jgi:hypothetical protein
LVTFLDAVIYCSVILTVSRVGLSALLSQAYASDSILKSYSSSSTSHQNQKNNNASIKLNPKPVAKTRKGTKGPV